ncbi:MAG: hypothetical protein IKX33_08320 [Prevotella sp.]|nr:hypothetical protein [Prevotella sp.]
MAQKFSFDKFFQKNKVKILWDKKNALPLQPHLRENAGLEHRKEVWVSG